MDTISPFRATLAIAALAFAACGGGDASPDAPPLTAVEIVPAPAGPGAMAPHLDVGPDGRVYLSWLEPAGDSAHVLRFATFEGGWSRPRTIRRGTDFWVNWADVPSLVALPGGALAAHWLARIGPGTYHYEVRIARSFDGGQTWTEPVVPHRDSALAEHGFVSLFKAPGGELAAVWLDGRKFARGVEEMTLRYTTIARGGRRGAEVLLDGRTCDCCQTDAARTAKGPVVVYRDRTEQEVRDIYITRLVDGSWTEPEPVHRDGWVMPACPVNGPAVAADGRRVAVAWYTAADNAPRVRVAFSEDAGKSFGAPVRIDGGGSGGPPLGRVDIALLPDGRALVSWLARTDGGAALRVRAARPDGRLSPARTVARTSAARASGFPRMVRSGRTVVFAWTDPGGAERPSRVRVATARLVGS